MQLGRQGRQVADGGVGGGHGRVFRAGNDRRDCREVQTPAQGHLGECQAGRHQRLEGIGEVYAGLEGQTGKGLADIERFAVAVVGAVVRGGKLRVLCVFTGQQAAGKRQAHDDGDVLALGVY